MDHPGEERIAFEVRGDVVDSVELDFDGRKTAHTIVVRGDVESKTTFKGDFRPDLGSDRAKTWQTCSICALAGYLDESGMHRECAAISRLQKTDLKKGGILKIVGPEAS